LHLWKRRWFVLREGCLYFHKDQSAAEAGGRGKVFLVHSVVIERGESYRHVSISCSYCAQSVTRRCLNSRRFSLRVGAGLLGMPHNLRMVVTNEEDAAMALAFPSEHTLLTWHRALTGGVSTQPCSPSPQSWGEQWPSSPQAPHADAPPAERHFGFSAHGAAASGLEAGPDHPPPAGRPSLGADGDAARRDARGAAAAVLSEAALARHRAQARPDPRRPAAPPRAPRPALRRPADAPGLPGSAPKERACMAPPGRGCPRGRGGAR
jgi:hypothetical protein